MIVFCITLLFSSNILDCVCLCVCVSHRYSTNYPSSPPYTRSSCISISCCSSEHSDKTSSQTPISTENGTHTPFVVYSTSLLSHIFFPDPHAKLYSTDTNIYDSPGEAHACVSVSPTCTIRGVRLLACPDGTTLCVLPTCIYVMLKRAALRWR